MSHTLINFSLSPELGVLGELLELRGKGMVSFMKVSSSVPVIK